MSREKDGAYVINLDDKKSNDNPDDKDNDNNIIFTINDTKLYVVVVTLSARGSQKLSKILGIYFIVFFNKQFIKGKRWIVDDKKSKGAHRVYLLTEMQLYTLIFFGIEYIHEEVLTEIKNKSIIHNIFRIQDNESIMCGLYCIAFHRIYTCRKN